MGLKYKRILLKLSGEALSGEQKFGLDYDVVQRICESIKKCTELGAEVAIVVVGGNFWRGRSSGKMDRTRADHMGMLGTVINALALADALEQLEVPVRVQTAIAMQQVAEPLHISKKTIYTVYPSKEALLLDMVDHAFAEIHHCKQEILAGSGTLQEKLRAVIIAMPTEYAALDLRQMKELDEKYPVVAARVRSQLENGWEPTMALLEQAVAEGVMRPVSLPVLRQMITASIESFLADRSLAESGVQYVAVLEEMISILLEGVLPR